MVIQRCIPVMLIITGISLLANSIAAEKPASDTAAPDSTTVTATPVDSSKTEKPLELTIEELAKYNGKNGMPIYVAVDGLIYDLTEVKAWKKGKHHGRSAGKDQTAAIKKSSPHGTRVLKDKKVVGKLVTK